MTRQSQSEVRETRTPTSVTPPKPDHWLKPGAERLRPEDADVSLIFLLQMRPF